MIYQQKFKLKKKDTSDSEKNIFTINKDTTTESNKEDQTGLTLSAM
ncbi:MAG: hypothetical protein Edafosvirus45_7, partial [Edafosvirus sp.]